MTQVLRAEPPSSLPDGEPPMLKRRWSGGAFVLLLGIVLPLITIGIEWSSGFCAGVFFDPIPTLGHLLLAFVVPLSNLAVWLMVRRPPKCRGLLGALNAFALMASLYYALMFVHLMPAACFAVLCMGLGLLPLAPLLSFIAGIVARLWLRRWTADGQPARVPRLVVGLAVGLLAVVAVQLPISLTNVGMALAASDSPAVRQRGLNLLRRYGDARQVLAACYLDRSSRVDPVLEALPIWDRVTPERARQVYYRWTGRSFNSVPLPESSLHGRVRARDFRWDAEQGQQAVAGVLPGLSLAESRLDGTLDGDAALAYLEWILVLRNDDPWQQEARAQMALPPGAVVSRVTLWVNGEEREAAFGGRDQVTQAYQAVVSQRRDPLLVTTAGPDRILLQCFPVPPRGGQMKLRIGMTAPLQLARRGQGVLALPALIERNFEVGPALQRSVWLEATTPLSPIGDAAGRLSGETVKKGHHALRGTVSESDLSHWTLVRVERDAGADVAVTREAVNGQQGTVVQRVQPDTEPPAARLVVVVDGSCEMDAYPPRIARWLRTVPAGTQLAILVASDDVIQLTGGSPERLLPVSEHTLDDATRRLYALKYRGGADNVPALCQAWDLVADGGQIVWLHGPQAELLDPVELLKQRLERRPGDPKLTSIEMAPGPNRVLEALSGLVDTRGVGRETPDNPDPIPWLPGERLKLVRSVSEAGEALPPTAKPASAHLARLWAFGQVMDLVSSGSPGARERAASLATSYQLVTPVSGAVVLETAAQYSAAGLTPASASNVPGIPEPNALWLLAGAAAGSLLLRRRRKLSHSK